MTSRMGCHIRYDPEADVALLSFTESSRSGGVALDFDDDSGLAGLLRLGAGGEFDHLELLGARRAIPQLVTGLNAPPSGVRDYCRGVVNVHLAAGDEQGAVRFDLVDISADGGEYEISVRAKSSPSVLATLTYDINTGALRSLTLFPVGNLLQGIPGITSD
ncbi:DUF2283 domain-containing protein [Streptomyces sp. NPDC003077]|uniref:DUF2283 domain-containing protein n=1 Tax=Streptomyces sp. NPDC003077 TaxID=3154443 RepID=UPI0033ADE389